MVFMRGVVIFSLVACGFIHGQETSIDLAKKQGEAYLVDCMFALDAYHMVAAIDAESTPGSDLLFTSKSIMEIFHTKELHYEKFYCRPRIISDDRIKGNQGNGVYRDYGPFARLEMWERIQKDGNVYDMFLNGKPIKPDFSKPVHQAILNLSTPCVKPQDWPTHTPGIFHGSMKESQKNNYEFVFGEKMTCIFASDKDGVIDSHWARIDSSQAVDVVTFKNNLPIRHDLCIFGKSFDPKKYDLSECSRIVKTETTWAECGDAFVPKTIVSKFSDSAGAPRSTHLSVEFSVSIPGEKQFEDKKVEVNRILDRDED